METPKRRRPGRGFDQGATERGVECPKGIRRPSPETRSRSARSPRHQNPHSPGVLRQGPAAACVVTTVSHQEVRMAIVPRWEWRTFGTRFGIAESRFAKLTPG